jgi:hypothetical protein
MYPPTGRAAVVPRPAGRHDRIPTNQSADFSDRRLRRAVFDLDKSLIRWSPIEDYTAFTAFAP